MITPGLTRTPGSLALTTSATPGRLGTAARTWVTVIMITTALLASCAAERSDAAVDSGAPTLDAAQPDGAAADGYRFFGFVGVECGYDDPTDAEVKASYLDEVTGFTNVAHTCVPDPSADMSATFERERGAGVRALLDVQSVLFETVADTSTPSGARARLRADAADRWNEYVARNDAWLTEDYVAAFFPVDEPTWNGVSAADLGIAVALLKASRPLIDVALIEAYAALDQLVIPVDVDWVGFDRYDTIAPDQDPAWQGDLATLKAKRTREGQRLLLVLDAQWRPYYAEAGIDPEDMADVARSVLAVAAREPDVIGIVGYLWPGGIDMPEQVGARALPEAVQAVYREAGAVARERMGPDR